MRQTLDEENVGSGIFDTVIHEILLSMLDYYCVRELINNWLKSYLTDHKQYVSINDYNSSFSSIVYGFPQGSVLGPILFLLNIKDLYT